MLETGTSDREVGCPRRHGRGPARICRADVGQFAATPRSPGPRRGVGVVEFAALAPAGGGEAGGPPAGPEPQPAPTSSGTLVPARGEPGDETWGDVLYEDDRFTWGVDGLPASTTPRKASSTACWTEEPDAGSAAAGRMASAACGGEVTAGSRLASGPEKISSTRSRLEWRRRPPRSRPSR